ncbi:MAG: sigma-70 family RNA polymerase sigma factor [Acidobacteriota bacterium]
MFFSKSIGFDEGSLTNVAAAARLDTDLAELEFIDKLRAGDAHAFDTLVHRYSGDIYALLYRMTDNAEEAGDLTQETFLSALKAIKGFRGDSELRTWLFRIALNHSRNRFRWWSRRSGDKTVSLDATVGGGERLVQDTLASNSPGPEETAIRRERETALRTALVDLPDIFRTVVIMCDIEGMTYDEIAQVLELNLGTVKSRIARGRRELREKLKGI